jgi:glycosyltransferase A (GT-A) superfamily protein (DUF2064 family)
VTPQLLVIAKAPVPGRVKTRLVPPCTHASAALIAAAALADTLDAVSATPAARRVLVVEGSHPPPDGWHLVAQRGLGLGERLVHAFADTAMAGVPSLLVGMDTPQATPALLAVLSGLLEAADAVLAPAVDGGWWALALRDPTHARVLADVPMSTSDTGTLTVTALRGLGLTVASGPRLRDVDVAADAYAVAALCPGSRFAEAVSLHLGTPEVAVAAR